MSHVTVTPRSPIKTEIIAMWTLSWPMLIAQLASVGMGVADVAMTGHVGAADLAAVALGSSLWSIVMVTVMGIMMAINAMVAHDVGAGSLTRIPHLVRQGLWMGLGVGIVACVLINLGTLVFDHLALDPSVRDQATLYVHIISTGLLPFAVCRALYGYSTSLNQTKPIMLISLGALALNILMNWLLIYGYWGMPKLGALGCAVATSISMWFMLGAMWCWIRRAPAYRASYPFGQREGARWSAIKPMLKMGLPIGITYFAEVSAFGAVALLVARFGVITLSAHQIALNFVSLVFMVPLSVGIALITRVGQALGEGDPIRARFVAWVGVGMAVVFGLLSAAGIALFRHQIAAAYTSDPAVQALTAHLLLFAAFFQLSDSTQVAAASAIRGYKVTRSPMVIHLAAFWGFSLPLGCVLGLAPSWLPWGPVVALEATGFWIGLVLGLTVASLLLVWFLHRLSWRRVQVHGVAPANLAL